MPVPTLISSLSQTAASNSPPGSESPTTADDYLRTAYAFLATLRDGKGFSTPATLASAATTDIGAQNSLAVEITGTTTITSFGTSYNGPRFLRFTGALILTHNATTLNLPGAANITTVAGDTCIVYPNSTPNGWNVVQFQRAASLTNGAAASGAVTTSGLTQATARILGRTTASTGGIEELTAGASLSLSAGSLNVADAGITPAKLSGGQSGSAPAVALRGWVRFNGSGTVAVIAGINVSSVTDNGVGNYTINHTVSYSDANYGMSGNCQGLASNSTLIVSPQPSRTVSACSIWTTSCWADGVAAANLYDSAFIDVFFTR